MNDGRYIEVNKLEMNKTEAKKQQRKTILVAGGAGFIGSNLCKRLCAENETKEILCLDNYYTGRKENIAELLQKRNFNVIEADITKTLPEAVKNRNIAEIYNLACPASPPQYQKDPVYTLRTNVLGTMRLLELAREKQAKLLQASTSEVYGEPEMHPQRESYRGNVNPIGIRACYDEGKRCAETLCFDYARTYSVEAKVVRIFNTYGPNMDPQDGRVVSNFIVQALEGSELTVYGDGKQTRSLCYVDDLVDGLIKMMAAKDFAGPVNLGNAEEYTVKELAEKIRQLTQTKGKIAYRPRPADDPTRRRPDNALAREKLGWQPRVSAQEGLEKTVAYFRWALKRCGEGSAM